MARTTPRRAAWTILCEWSIDRIRDAAENGLTERDAEEVRRDTRLLGGDDARSEAIMDAMEALCRETMATGRFPTKPE